MCGLAGYIGQNHREQSVLVQKMAGTLIHRGPDHQVAHIHDFASIAFNRLAIVDLTPSGHQPFEYDRLIVYCNGEIYNHLELKKKFHLNGACKSRSDIEMIPHLYRKLGLDFLHELNGMFAMVLIDQKEGKTFFVSDRLGKKPLFYKQTPNGVFFASELKSFLLNFPFEIDRESFNTGFFLSYLPYPLTPIRGVEKLKPGSVLCIEGGQVVACKPWYVLKPRNDFARLKLDQHRVAYKELLDDSVRIRMEADVKSGFFLSGGLDSTSIAGSAVGQGYKDLHAFCAIIDGKENTTDNVNGMRFANDHGLNLHRININADIYDQNMVRSCWVFDEGNYESCGMNFMIIAREAKKYLTILLDGTGGDEIFFGYPYQLVLNKMPEMLRGKLPHSRAFMNWVERKCSPRYRAVLRALTDIDTWFFFERSFVPVDMMHCSANFRPDMLYEQLIALIREYDTGFTKRSDLNRLSYLDILGFCMANFLRADRGSMAYSIEPRSPLSDYRLWECVLSLSSKMKFGDPPSLKSYMRRISPFLPAYILNAKKEGFSNPLFGWFQSESNLRAAALRIISRNSEFLDDVFSPSFVKAVVAPWKNPQSAEWMDGIRLHMLTAAALWNEIFVKKSIQGGDYDVRLTSLA